MESPTNHLDVDSEASSQPVGSITGPDTDSFAELARFGRWARLWDRSINRGWVLMYTVTALILVIVFFLGFAKATAPRAPKVNNTSTDLETAFSFAPSLSLRPSIGQRHGFVSNRPSGIQNGGHLRRPMTLAKPRSRAPAMYMSSELGGGSKRLEDLLQLPVPKLPLWSSWQPGEAAETRAQALTKLVSTLDSMDSNLVLRSSPAQILDKACANILPLTGNVAKDIDLQEGHSLVFRALQKKGILRGFGSCENALIPLPNKDNFKESDQKLATGLSREAWRSSSRQALLDGAGSTLGLALLYVGNAAVPGPGQALASALLTGVFLDTFLLGGSIRDTIYRSVVRPDYGKLVMEHEAGHFLVGYLLGNPIQSCLLSAWAALKDGRFFGGGAAGGTVIYDTELAQLESGKKTEGDLSCACLDRYSIVNMAGIAAEAMSRGAAEGGQGDEQSLMLLLFSTDGGKTWPMEKIESQQRWAAAQAYLLLKEHESAYKALCKALSEGASTGEAIMAIEGALAMMPALPAEARKRLQIDKPVDLRATERTFMPALASQEEAGTRSAEIEARLAEIDTKLAEIEMDKLIQERKATLAELDAKLADKTGIL